MWASKHFKKEEIFPSEMLPYSDFVLEGIICPKLLPIADKLRDRFGALICNDYCWGGKWNYRGFRPSGVDVGAKYSQHRFGRALDFSSNNVTAEEMRDDILKNEFDWREEGITVMEDSVTWLHFDTRHTDSDYIILI